jgi:hypothetical protein
VLLHIAGRDTVPAGAHYKAAAEGRPHTGDPVVAVHYTRAVQAVEAAEHSVYNFRET